MLIPQSLEPCQEEQGEKPVLILQGWEKSQLGQLETIFSMTSQPENGSDSLITLRGGPSQMWKDNSSVKWSRSCSRHLGVLSGSQWTTCLSLERRQGKLLGFPNYLLQVDEFSQRKPQSCLCHWHWERALSLTLGSQASRVPLLDVLLRFWSWVGFLGPRTWVHSVHTQLSSELTTSNSQKSNGPAAFCALPF
jgi:hypothetical protein